MSEPVTQAPPPPPSLAASLATGLTSYRWHICALLFIANTINYMDRQVLSFLAPMLQTKIGWNEVQYGYIVVAFQLAYAIGLLSVGGIIDKIGVKLGYAISIGVWSLSSMSHALARTALAFGTSRFFLGLGESGNFPAAIKTVAEWFPKKERALATGLFNSGTSVGAILVPLTVPWIVDHWGWQAAFLFTGGFSLIWVILWLITYKSPEHESRVNAAELAHIRSDAGEAVASTRIPWLHLLGYRQCWAVLIGKFLTDPVWWFLLFWLPKYFSTRFHLKLEGLAGPIMVIYIAACVGSVFGGWLPAIWLRMGLSIRAARRGAMLTCALCTLPIAMVGHMSGLWSVVAVISLACAAHQGWSANIFSLCSDLFPRAAVASVTGIAGFGGAIGGMLAAWIVGLVLQHFHTYANIFLVAGMAYLTAWLVIQYLTRKPEISFSI
ncbi:MFS transporter [Acidicapsa dinghuensis]|uniref:MFS transporter n=1 Tax=Acidicapsa dinghuensis TaxID=2218256 RepID=A0ABW1EDQ7_9BACT|nr:MFS transporter [Acidicapsa dinghuensis]